eukprot:m.1068 g.1068  ORF g.1068 m.1068 type:complete len:62 (+) comp1058_c0_seq1:96-281(+)
MQVCIPQVYMLNGNQVNKHMKEKRKANNNNPTNPTRGSVLNASLVLCCSQVFKGRVYMFCI